MTRIVNNGRRSPEEILEILSGDNYLKEVAGWVVFDCVSHGPDGDKWKFLSSASTSHEPFDISDESEEYSRYSYEPSIENVESAVEGGKLRAAGMKLNYTNSHGITTAQFFFIPVGKIHFTD